MAEYIDRQALDVVAFTDRDGTFSDGIQWLLEYIDALPTADVVEVVRCKDCKHWIPYDWIFSEVWKSQNIDDYAESEIGCTYCDTSMGAMDYCSRGERKDD